MSVNYSTSILTSRLQQVVNAIDAGAGNGVLKLLTAGGSVLSSLSLAKPCATVSAGLLTFSGTLLDPAAAAGGTATRARCEDSAGTVAFSGLTVSDPSGTSDILLTPTNVIVAGQTIGITAATIQGN